MSIRKRITQIFKRIQIKSATDLDCLTKMFPVFFYWKDIYGCYQGCNKAFLDLIGLKKIIGKTDAELWPKSAEILKNNDKKTILQGNSIFVEEKIILNDGREKTFNVIKAPWKDKNNNIIGIAASLTDITQFIKNEAELEFSQKSIKEKNDIIVANVDNIVLCTPGSIYWKDMSGTYLGCNDFMVKEAGLKSRSDIIGKTDKELWPEQAEKIIENDLRVINSGKLMSMEESVKGKTFFSIKMPIKDKNGNIIGVICNSHDIGYLKEIESELKEAKDLAEKSNQAKSQFLATVSHELRSPLTGILGMVHFLKTKENLTKEQKQTYIEKISISAKHLLALVNDFLDFSKLEAGKFELTTAPIDLKSLIIETTSILMPQATAKGLEIVIDYHKDIPHLIFGDSRALRQIIINLVSNAIKFTEVGFIRIDVKILYQCENSVQLLLSVSDTGIGIPENKLAIIFDHFQQVDSSYSRRYSGTGLGLSITKKLIEIMDGTLEVVSKIRQGSTFSCKLSFSLQEKSIIEHPWVLHQSNVQTLIVEDTYRGDILQKQIGSSNCQTTKSKEALNFFIVNQQGLNPYSIVIIDDQIHAKSAYELAKKINDSSGLKKPMLVLLGSSPSSKAREKAEKAGFFEYIVKPIQPLEMETSLTVAWEKWIELGNLKAKEENIKSEKPLLLTDCQKFKYQNFNIIKANNSKRHVLLVDDEEIVQSIHREFLKELDCEVESADSGETALEMLESNSNYDILFVDMGLPGMSGPELVKIYRQREKSLDRRITIIALTGYSSQEDKEIFLEAGVNAVLIKPVTIEQLKQILKDYS